MTEPVNDKHTREAQHAALISEMRKKIEKLEREIDILHSQIRGVSSEVYSIRNQGGYF